jgi:hypothetical protein
VSFTVTGSLDGTAYTCTVPDDGPPTGSGRIVAALTSWVGDTVLASPTGPAYVVDLGDPDSVWCALSTRTAVTLTEGDVPDLLPAMVLGAVY